MLSNKMRRINLKKLKKKVIIMIRISSEVLVV